MVQSVIEPLEGRTLFTSVLTGTTLVVSGTPAADAVRFTVRGGELILWEGSLATAYPARDVRSLRVETGGGNDRIRLGQAVRIPATVEAGDGDDFVTGGASADSISGGAGRDRLGGGRGDDTLVGGPDIDRLAGGAGNDYLDSADGVNDFLSGGPGRDRNNTYADSGNSVEIRPSRPRRGAGSGSGGSIDFTGGVVVGSGGSGGISIVDNVIG